MATSQGPRWEGGQLGGLMEAGWLSSRNGAPKSSWAEAKDASPSIGRRLVKDAKDSVSLIFVSKI